MAAASAKTVRLARGKHLSPEQGVCVLELASLLEGGAFTDRPPSVSPVVGALLRSLNDAVDDRRRQALFAYAAAAVGSRGAGAVERKRMARLLDALDAAHRTRPAWRRLLAGRPPRRELPLGPTELEAAAMDLVRLQERSGAHRAVLALVDSLLRPDAPEGAASASRRPAAALRRRQEARAPAAAPAAPSLPAPR